MSAAAFRRPALAAGLALVALALSGCVYLHLLELKRQLADFDRHFAVTAMHGVCIDCLDPLLLDSDLRWLGVQPETMRRLGQAAQWRVRWVKELPPGMHEPAVYDVALDLLFVEQKLTRVAIEERFFAFFPKPLFLKFLRDAGTAHIDRGLRRAEIAEALPGGEAAALLPTASTIRTMLGAPSDRSAAAGTLTLHYDYRPAGPTGPRMKPIAVIFIFDVTTGRLQVLDIRLPAGSLHFNLAAPAAG